MSARPPRLGFLAPLWAAAPRARRARWARLALVPALVLAAGCQNGDDDDDPTGPGGRVEGTYALTEFGSQPVPLEAQTEDGETVSVRGGRLTLDGGAYEVTFDIRIDGQRVQNLNDEGEYEVRNDRVRFSSSAGGGEFEGVVSGRRVDFEVDGLAFRFERE